jgi:glycosyltransferase involved in cell wall biosynthesis
LARNPVDLTEIVPRTPDSAGGPVRIAFVGRISVRKGVELVVALSHRLADLAGEVVLDVVGDHTLWSDYRPLLVDLNPAIARYLGPMNRAQVIALLSGSDLMVQPARYEPFGLTVSEALALGTPVVASDEVGAAEDVSRECCPVVPSGDIDALEAAVRTMITRVRTPGAAQIRATARTEAERLFSPEMTTQAVLSAIRDVLAEPPSR